MKYFYSFSLVTFAMLVTLSLLAPKAITMPGGGCTLSSQTVPSHSCTQETPETYEGCKAICAATWIGQEANVASDWAADAQQCWSDFLQCEQYELGNCNSKLLRCCADAQIDYDSVLDGLYNGAFSACADACCTE